MEIRRQELINALTKLVANRTFSCPIDNQDFKEAYEFYEELRSRALVRRKKANGWYVYTCTNKAEKLLQKIKK